MAERDSRHRASSQPAPSTAQPLSIDEQQGMLLNSLSRSEPLTEQVTDQKKWLATIRIALTHTEPAVVHAALELIQKSDPALGIVVATVLLHRGERFTHVGERHLNTNIAPQTQELKEYGEVVGTLLYPPSESHTILGVDLLKRSPLDEDPNKIFEATVYVLLTEQPNLALDLRESAGDSLKELGSVGEAARLLLQQNILAIFRAH